MSGCCYTIYVKDIPGAVPEWVKDAQGNVRLELSDSSLYTRTKKVSTITEFNNIGSEGVLGFSLPKTDVNSYILSEYGRTSNFSFDNKTVIPVIVMEGARVLAEDYLRVLRVNASGWEVELFRGENFWKDALKGVRLCDLSFENITLNTTNLLTNWNADLGDVTYRFPLIDYGNWSNPATFIGGDPLQVATPGSAENEDFRPLFHVKELLEKAFCAIGWEFKSPILDTDFGRRLIAYILSDFNIPSEKYSFRAVVTDRHFGGVGAPLFNTPEYAMITEAVRAYDDFNLGFDNGGTPGFYRASQTLLPGCSPQGYFFTRGLSGIFRFRFSVTINTDFDQTDRLLQLKVKQKGGTSPTFYANSFRVYPGTTTTHEASITVDVHPGFCYEFWIDEIIDSPGVWVPDVVIYSSNSGNGYWEVMPGSAVWVEPVKIIIRDGMFLVPNTLIDCSYNGLSLLEGVMHLFGPGLLETDIAGKTVTLYHRDNTTLGNNEVPESFYLNELYANELDEFLECDNFTSTLKTGVEERFLRLRYQKSDDSYIELSGYGDEVQPHQKDIDFGANRGLNETLKLEENPFFHPTLMRECFSLLSPSDYGNVYIPVMWDNDEGEISFDIKPRILVWGGSIQQPGELSGGFYIPRTWKWETPDFEAQFIPFSYTQYSDQIGIVNPQLVPYNLAYGEYPEYPFDLYTIFWQTNILERDKAFTYTLKAMLNAGSFEALTFRNLLHVYYQGTPFLAKLNEISSYNPCTGDATLILQPVVYTPENCTVINPPVNIEPVPLSRYYEINHRVDNYVSFLYYDLTDNSPTTFFAGLISQGVDVIVTGRDTAGQVLIFDSTLPPFLNSLTEIEPGRGYIVSITGNENKGFFNTGFVIEQPEFKISLAPSFNIVWYVFEQTRSVTDYFADLISSGCLIEIRGIDNVGNILVYNPNDPGNATLTEVSFGKGYIVRCSCSVNANNW